MVRKIVLFLFLVFFSVGCFASNVKVPANVFLFNEPKEIFVEITNDSSSTKTLKLELFSPISFRYFDLVDSIKAHDSETIGIRFLPSTNLKGDTYRATLNVYLDGEKITKEITLFVMEKTENANKLKENSNALSLAGFVSFFSPAVWGSALTLENALNAVLIVIAAILLIAFISRFIKRLETQK